MSRKLAMLIILMFLGAHVTVAQETLALSLAECLDRAMTSNQQLSLKRLEREKQSYEYTMAKRYFIPEISAYARFFQYLDDKPVYVFPQNINENLSGPVQLGAPLNFYSGITLNQHILDARMFGSKSIRGRIDEISTLQEEIDRDDIRYEVIKTFYQARIADESKALLEYNSGRLEKIEKTTRSAVENGMARQTSLEEIQLRMEEIELAEAELYNQEAQVLSYLKFLCDIPADVTLQLVDTPETPTALVTDSSRSKQYELLELKKTLDAESFTQQSSATYPTLDFFAAFQWLQQEGYGDLFTSDGTWFNQHMIGLQLNVPILSPGSRKAKSQEVRINQDIITAQQSLLMEKNRIERAKATDDLRLAAENVELTERKINLYQKQFDQAQVRYEQEYASLTELLEAEEKVRSAKIEYQRKKIAYFLAILEVNRAYGSLDSFTD